MGTMLYYVTFRVCQTEALNAPVPSLDPIINVIDSDCLPKLRFMYLHGALAMA